MIRTDTNKKRKREAHMRLSSDALGRLTAFRKNNPTLFKYQAVQIIIHNALEDMLPEDIILHKEVSRGKDKKMTGVKFDEKEFLFFRHMAESMGVSLSLFVEACLMYEVCPESE